MSKTGSNFENLITITKDHPSSSWQVKSNFKGVCLPNGLELGTEQENFHEISEAQQYVAEIRAYYKSIEDNFFNPEYREFLKLKPLFTENNHIKQIDNGLYYHRFVDENGTPMGIRGDLKEVKMYFLDRCNFKNRPSANPDIVLKDGNQTINICEMDNYNPLPDPTNKVLEKAFHIYSLEKKSGIGENYKKQTEYNFNSEEIPGWDKKCLKIIRDFLEKEGKSLFTNGEINRLDRLTPSEASQIAFEVARIFAIYDVDSSYRNGEVRLDVKESDTPFDFKPVWEIIKDAKNNKPNGVCRTFANVSKVMFNALKLNQSSNFNYLTNSHVLAVDSEVFSSGVPHAFPVFYTQFPDGNCDIWIEDPTWQSNKILASKTKHSSVRSILFWRDILNKLKNPKEQQNLAKQLFEQYVQKVLLNEEKNTSISSYNYCAFSSAFDIVNKFSDLDHFSLKMELGKLFDKEYNFLCLNPSKISNFRKLFEPDKYKELLIRQTRMKANEKRENLDPHDFCIIGKDINEMKKDKEIIATELKKIPRAGYKSAFDFLMTSKQTQRTFQVWYKDYL